MTEKAVAEELVRGWWRAAGGRVHGARLDVLVAEWLDHERVANTHGVMLRKHRVLAEFQTVTGIQSPVELTVEACERYMASLRDKSACVQVQRRGYVSRFCQWLVYPRRVLDNNPMRWTVAPKQDRSAPPVFMDEGEWQTALQTAAAHGLWWVWFAAYLGLRRGSLEAMRWRDLQEQDGVWYLTVRNVKSGKFHRLRLPAALVEILPKLGRGEPDDAVFVVGQRTHWWRAFRVVKASSPTMSRKGGGIHDLRRAVGSFLAAKGTSLLMIAKILGHADVRVTARHYAHLLPEVAAEELEKLPPPE